MFEQDYDRERFGSLLRAVRCEHELSQEDLAMRVGVSRNTISRIENGLQCPSLELVFELAKTLEIRPSELFGFYEEESEGGLAWDRALSVIQGFDEYEIALALRLLRAIRE